MTAAPVPRVPIEGEEIRFLGACYTALSATVALAALTTHRDGLLRSAALAMLASLALQGFWMTLRSGLGALRRWRRLQRQATVRHALQTLTGAYRVLTLSADASRSEHHVAVGPNGVFVVVSCDDAGRVWASDRRLVVNSQLTLRNLVEECHIAAVRAGERVRRHLGRPVPVHGVLCFTRALVIVGQEIRGIKITQVTRLARLIVSVTTANAMSQADIEAAAAALAEAPQRVDPSPPAHSSTRRLRAKPPSGRSLTLIARPPTPHSEVGARRGR